MTYRSGPAIEGGTETEIATPCIPLALSNASASVRPVALAAS
jgi:hypothetical protein